MGKRARRGQTYTKRGRGGFIAMTVFVLALLFFAYAAISGLLSKEQRLQITPERTTDHALGQTGPAIGKSTATAQSRESALLPAKPATAQATSSGGFSGTLGACSAVVLDGDGNTLYSLAGDERKYPASTTKVLTALIALEYGKLSDSISVGEEVNLPKPDSSIAGLRYGERLTLEQLLHALLIPSGNDAAYVIATYIGRKISGDYQMDAEEAVGVFVQRMNSRAEELGATHSHFANPDGYHDEEHYTTASDMGLIAREAMTHSAFRQIVAKTSYALPDIKVKDKDGKQTTQHRVLQNTNELLDKAGPYYLKVCNGIKTGHTTEAGYCLISCATQGDKSVQAVVMDSAQESVWMNSAELLQWGLAQR